MPVRLFNSAILSGRISVLDKLMMFRLPAVLACQIFARH
jgi:hypothetical protein